MRDHKLVRTIEGYHCFDCGTVNPRGRCPGRPNLNQMSLSFVRKPTRTGRVPRQEEKVDG